MMIDVGEAQVFKGHMAKLLHGFVGRERALSYLLKQLLEGVGIHRARTHSEVITGRRLTAPDAGCHRFGDAALFTMNT
jgi:hypothetical protein